MDLWWWILGLLLIVIPCFIIPGEPGDIPLEPDNSEEARAVTSLGDSKKARATLDELISMGNAAVPILLKALSAPRGQRSTPIDEANNPQFWRTPREQGWDGDLARRLAAEGLGRIKDTRAVSPLLNLLGDYDRFLAGKAVWALGEIGDVRAVPHLIPLLADINPNPVFWEPHAQRLWEPHAQRLCEVAAASLRKLDEAELVDALSQTLQGERESVSKLRGKNQRVIVRSLAVALNDVSSPAAACAAWAMGELGDAYALPVLHARLRSLASDEMKEACAQAIAKLESLVSLPRSTAAGAFDQQSLPRATMSPKPSTDELPRVPPREYPE